MAGKSCQGCFVEILPATTTSDVDLIPNCQDCYPYGGGISFTEGSIMARPRLPIVLHLSPDEIARLYRTCRTGVEKTHWQILWFLTRTAEPPTPAQVASQVGLTPAWVRTVLKRWNAQGPEGLADRRPLTNGGQSKLTA